MPSIYKPDVFLESNGDIMYNFEMIKYLYLVSFLHFLIYSSFYFVVSFSFNNIIINIIVFKYYR